MFTNDKSFVNVNIHAWVCMNFGKNIASVYKFFFQKKTVFKQI